MPNHSSSGVFDTHSQPCTPALDRIINELSIDIDGLTIAALHKPAKVGSGKAGSGKEKLLCVHGWLDNANSFVGLMPHLDDYEMVAIDLPGHGKSSHYPAGADYHLSDMPFVLLKIAEKLGWDKFHLLGHSLGGCISSLTAVAAPASILSLIMLEASGPVTEDADQLPARLQRAQQHRTTPGMFNSRVFGEVQEAVDVRLAAAKMQQESARLIVERQLLKVSDGYQWQFDPRHRYASPVYMTEEQVLAVLRAIPCPVSVVVAADGYLSNRAETTIRLGCIPDCTISEVSGNHHMHMDDPAATADCIHQHFALMSGMTDPS